MGALCMRMGYFHDLGSPGQEFDSLEDMCFQATVSEDNVSVA